MLFSILIVGSTLALLSVYSHFRLRHMRLRRVLNDAQSAGLALDQNKNIDPEISFSGMLVEEERKGVRFEGKQARFMELLRIVAENPKTIAEIRFLFAEGMEPIVRPDGLVYVPHADNEHLYMEGEFELLEEDLDSYVEKGLLQQRQAEQTLAA